MSGEIKISFSFLSLLICFEREREKREGEGKRERERERIPSWLRMSAQSLMWGLELTNCEIVT